MTPTLRTIDQQRIEQYRTLRDGGPESADIWFIHTVLSQCFLPYRDPKDDMWFRKNGDFSILLESGHIEDIQSEKGYRKVGLPFGSKPRLFQSYVCTQVIKQKSPVIPVELSMTAMLRELGFEPRGGKRGTIISFKDQITRFARCSFTIVGPGPRGGRRYISAPPIKRFDIWFPSSPDQQTLWPSEIVLTDDYYYSLKDHAVPFDFRGMKAIQNNARAQDIYLWMTQRLCRIHENKPLFMTWDMLAEMFGGAMSNTSRRMFPKRFKDALRAAWTAYPDARIEEDNNGFRFHHSKPPIPKTNLLVNKPGK